VSDPFRFRVNTYQRDAAAEHGRDLVSYPSFEEAADDAEATLVLTGDWGLTIYLTAPARLVRCDASTLWLLLSDLDAIQWMTGDFDLATVALVRLPVGAELYAPHGPGAVLDGVWTSKGFVDEIREQASEVVLRSRSRIELALLRAERDREVARRKSFRSTRPQIALAWDFDIHPPVYPFMPLNL
jgi:hypothetical protein